LGSLLSTVIRTVQSNFAAAIFRLSQPQLSHLTQQTTTYVVSCFIGHPVTNVSRSRTSLNLWPQRPCLNAASKWHSLDKEFSCIITISIILLVTKLQAMSIYSLIDHRIIFMCKNMYILDRTTDKKIFSLHCLVYATVGTENGPFLVRLHFHENIFIWKFVISSAMWQQCNIYGSKNEKCALKLIKSYIIASL
jgi:hypothetical protein